MLVYGAVDASRRWSLYFAQPRNSGWVITAALSLGLVVWITVVNLLYLLLQIVVGAEDCSPAMRVAPGRGSPACEFRTVSLIFVATLVLVVLATAASILATAALSSYRVRAAHRHCGSGSASAGCVDRAQPGLRVHRTDGAVAYLRIYRSARGDATGDLRQIGLSA